MLKLHTVEKMSHLSVVLEFKHWKEILGRNAAELLKKQNEAVGVATYLLLGR